MLGTTAARPRPVQHMTALAVVLLLVAAATLPSPRTTASPADRGAAVQVIVRAASGAVAAAVDAVEATGGRVVRPLPVIDGFVARVPAAAARRVAAAPGVSSVAPDRQLRLQHHAVTDDPAASSGTMWSSTTTIGARAYWEDGYTGAGVDVALIDSGVAPVEGLTEPGKVVNGPDLSFESQSDETRYVDTYGHGTHLAGIIAGRDGGVGDEALADDHEHFLGVAPGARLVNVKVADAEGRVDVSQVIAAIDWVVQHRTSNGLDIRVLTLAFGTDGDQDWRVDPLAHAVEVAWRSGIVVVVAGGNDGRSGGPLRDPASDPWVLAVAADDTRGTRAVDDDMVPAFSNRGDGERDPDVVAPGVSVVSLRAPGSTVEQSYPDAAVGDRFLRGTGTSQATAMAAGAAALVIDQRPWLAPDEVKALLAGTARRLPNQGRASQGSGLVALDLALDAPTPTVRRSLEASTGNGSLELARGSEHLVMDGVELKGEQDIFGTAFDTASWAEAAAAGSTWSGGSWNGSTWSGSSWSGSSWSGSTWSGSTWSGSTWSGSTWSGSSWSGSSWSSRWD